MENIEKMNLGDKLVHTRAALIDMDGVLYDSMKYHTLAWQRLMTELGVECTRDEFYLYEGMTGAATINLLFRRAFGHECPPDEIRRLYQRKTEYFLEFGAREMMPGAAEMVAEFQRRGIRCVLVTGSGQQSILDALDRDYPGVFAPDMRITAADVVHGKPHPEPYLRGLQKAGADASEAIVIENAPLGVRAGKAAGIFTVAVTTGPIPRRAFEDEHADLIFADFPSLLKSLTD